MKSVKRSYVLILVISLILNICLLVFFVGQNSFKKSDNDDKSNIIDTIVDSDISNAEKSEKIIALTDETYEKSADLEEKIKNALKDISNKEPLTLYVQDDSVSDSFDEFCQSNRKNITAELDVWENAYLAEYTTGSIVPMLLAQKEYELAQEYLMKLDNIYSEICGLIE